MSKFKTQLQKIGVIPAVLSLIALVMVIVSAQSFHTTREYHGWLGGLEQFFANAIQGIAKFFDNSYGWGIIVFTLIIRFLILPLMVYQLDSMKQMQTIQPQLSELQAKYRGRRDSESMQAMQAEQKALYQEADVNPFASFIPLLVQMPILIGLYQAILKTPELQQSQFMWFQLGHTDPYYILPFLAALFTFISSWISMQSNPVQSTSTKIMPYIFPVMIFLMALGMPTAISLYWVVSNAFQSAQVFILQNPFEARAARRAEADAEKERQRAVRKTRNMLRKRH